MVQNGRKRHIQHGTFKHIYDNIRFEVINLRAYYTQCLNIVKYIAVYLVVQKWTT